MILTKLLETGPWLLSKVKETIMHETDSGLPLSSATGDMGVTMKSGSANNRRFIFTILLWTVGFSILSAVPASAKYASMVIDANTGKVLHQDNPHALNYPASLTKMMTLYLLFEALDKGRIKMSTAMNVSDVSAGQPASALGMTKGQTITVSQAILALAVKSANDVAVVVAEALSGSQNNFALEMTAKARQLGMSRTTFRNPSGLPHQGQLSTARDMALLAHRLLRDFPHYYHYFSAEEFTYNNVTYKTHNRLLKSYDGADGIKTGYIKASGFNLVASAERGGRRLIGVVLGGNTAKARDRLMAGLLDKGFNLIGTPSSAQNKPSSLQDQPSTARNGPPLRKRKTETADSTPAPSATAPDGQWAIQVGVYNQYQPAYNVARKIAEKFPDILQGGSVTVAPLQKNNRKPMYRARIQGLSKKQAYQACLSLKRRDIDCMEVTVWKAA